MQGMSDLLWTMSYLYQSTWLLFGTYLNAKLLVDLPLLFDSCSMWMYGLTFVAIQSFCLKRHSNIQQDFQKFTDLHNTLFHSSWQDKSMESIQVLLILINPRRMRSEGYSSLTVCLSVSATLQAPVVHWTLKFQWSVNDTVERFDSWILRILRSRDMTICKLRSSSELITVDF